MALYKYVYYYYYYYNYYKIDVMGSTHDCVEKYYSVWLKFLEAIANGKG